MNCDDPAALRLRAAGQGPGDVPAPTYASVAHDISNLVFAIDARLEAIANCRTLEEASAHVAAIRQCVEGLRGLTRNLRRSAAPGTTPDLGSSP
jgi:hypothetical protein